MKLVSALGLLAGGFVLVPKGLWVFVALWGLAKVQPLEIFTSLSLPEHEIRHDDGTKMW
jgi:hypothetical protein